jgi:hypothetical protein
VISVHPFILCLDLNTSIMRRRYVEIEKAVVKGKTQVVARKVTLSPIHEKAHSHKRSAPSPERQSSSYKARRTESPPSFNDFQDYMDTTFESPPSPGLGKGKGGKVRLSHVCRTSFSLAASRLKTT